MNDEVATLVSADVFDSLSRFFDSPLWTVLRILIVIFLVLMWLALVVWVFRDAARRNNAPGYPRLMAAVALVIPYLGPLLYLALRPSETIEEQRERRLETVGLERQALLSCPDCGFPTEPKYLACPSCMRKLKEPCSRCHEPVDPRWALCPFCENPQSLQLGGRTDETAQVPRVTPEPAQ